MPHPQIGTLRLLLDRPNVLTCYGSALPWNAVHVLLFQVGQRVW